MRTDQEFIALAGDSHIVFQAHTNRATTRPALTITLFYHFIIKMIK